MLFATAGRFAAQHRGARRCRSGLTLVEILISTTVALIMLFTVVQLFEWVGSSVAQGRATLEMSGQIRGAVHRLREDLKGITVPMRPWPRSSSAEGYLECGDGPQRDATNIATNTTLGDLDDWLMFTARSVEEPYVGKWTATPGGGNIPIESQVAEIIWWVQPDSIGNFTLRRRVLLLRPDLNTGPGGTIPNWPGANLANLQSFYNVNDVSVHFNGAGQLVANTLADLTKRENRFAHNTGAFPFELNPATLVSLAQTETQQGDDVILSHVKAFDIRLFDPLASIRSDGNRALVPSDPGWDPTSQAEIGRGAFVDLNYNPGMNTVFSGPPHVRSQLTVPAYDTWSFHYEHDGVDQDGGGADQGTNGLDDNGTNGPDDVLERETSPPYPVALRGIQIKVRIDDPDSRQVREATVVHDFIPE